MHHAPTQTLLRGATTVSEAADPRSDHEPLLPQGSRKFLLPRTSSKGFWEEEPPKYPCLTRHVIFPGSVTGRWRLEAWDLYVSAMVLFVAYYQPYTIALYRVAQEPDVLVVINTVLNISFTVDLFLQFFIAVPRSEDSLHKNLYETDPVKLMTHYCSVPCSDRGRGGWFWLDLVTVTPGWVACVLAKDNSPNPVMMLRVLRLLQTVRMLRLVKLGEIVHARTGYPVFLTECVKFVIITTLTCHWIACLWVIAEGKITHGIISYEDSDNESWLSALIAAKGDVCVPDSRSDRFCVYVIAYYWAVTTLTSVGYGDITPQNRLEYSISVVCMTVIGYVWAYIVGSIVSILSSLNPEAAEFKRNLDELQNLMHRRGLPQPLQVKLRAYMHETKHFSRIRSQRQLVERCLSSGLQREVAARSAEVSCLMKGVFWMNDLEEEAILDLVRALFPVSYGPYELISMQEAMILMQKGIAGVKGRVLARGDIWGHCDILMETAELIDGTMPRTISYVEILMLTKGSLLEICRNYPRADRRMRRAQIKTAVARAFCQAAKKGKRMHTSLRSRREAIIAQDDLGEAVRAQETINQSPRDHPEDMNMLIPARKPVKQERASSRCITSFVNPGMKRLNAGFTSGNQERCDPPELRRLLGQVLEKQALIQDDLMDLRGQVIMMREGAREGSTPKMAMHLPFSTMRGWGRQARFFAGGTNSMSSKSLYDLNKGATMARMDSQEE